MDIKKTIDNSAKIQAAVDKLTQSDVLVGVPSSKAGRRDKGQPISNAALAYIHEFGSPARNIPARPFLFPGVRHARPEIISMMRAGAKEAIQGNTGAVTRTLNAVGMLARNAVVRAITDPEPPFVPLGAAAIRSRLQRTQAGRRKLRQIVDGGRQIGMSASESLTAYAQANWDTGGAGMNMQPLIDTGQLRASISYVVRDLPAGVKPPSARWGGRGHMVLSYASGATAVVRTRR